MSGRKLVNWTDDDGIPHESWSTIQDWGGGFEDEAITRMDFYRELRKIVPRLSVAERWVLLQLVCGYPVSRHDKDALMRLRRKVAATKGLSTALIRGEG